MTMLQIQKYGSVLSVINAQILAHAQNRALHPSAGLLADRPAIEDALYAIIDGGARPKISIYKNGAHHIVGVSSFQDLDDQPTADSLGGILLSDIGTLVPHLTSGKVPVGELPTADALGGVLSSQLGVSVATLTSGVLTTSQIPALSISDISVVASQSAMLALTAQRGDVAVRSDFNPARTFMLAADNPTVLANWIEVGYGRIASVNGQTGIVVLGYADVGAAPTVHTHDDRYFTETESDARFKPIANLDGHQVQDESSALTQRAILDFRGAGVTAVDEPGTGKTVVNISGATVGDMTETARGTGETATTAEVQAGTLDAPYVVTPAKLAAEITRRRIIKYFIDAERVTSEVNLTTGDTTVVCNQENFDTGNIYDPTTGIATVPSDGAGLWRIKGSVRFQTVTANENGSIGYSLNNGTPVYMKVVRFASNAQIIADFELELVLAVGDNIRIKSTVTLGSIDASAHPATRFQMRYLGAIS